MRTRNSTRASGEAGKQMKGESGGNGPLSSSVSGTEASTDHDSGFRQEAKAAMSREQNTAAAGGDDSMTEYERERQLQMQRNRERMLQLQLPDMAAASFVAGSASKANEKQKPTSRGVTGKRKKGREAGEAIELRRSTRQRGIQPDTALAQGINYETRDGNVVLNSSAAVVAVQPADRTPEKELPFSSLEASEDLDAQFLARLKVASGDASEPRKGAKLAGSAKGKRYSLAAEDVRKVVPRSVTIMDFFPSSDPENLIIAAGDNDGHLGIWDINKTASTDEDDEDAGGLLFRPHRQFISGLKWCRGGQGLCTVGYDGSLRMLDIESGIFNLSHHSADDGYSALGFHQGSEIAYMADSSGDVTILDPRSGKPVSRAELHAKKINSLEVEPLASQMFATASTDTTVAVWDVRKVDGKHPLAKLQHGRSCHGAFWDPSGSGGSSSFKHRLATISFDDTIRVFGSGGSDTRPSPCKKSASGTEIFSQVFKTKHNNNTGRWVLPFKATWSPTGDALVVGCMQRGVDMIDSKSGQLMCNLSSDFMTAIPMRTVFHPFRSALLAAATSSGRIHIFRNM